MKDNEKGESMKKPEVESTVEEDSLTNYISKALNEIFNTVDVINLNLFQHGKLLTKVLML